MSSKKDGSVSFSDSIMANSLNSIPLRTQFSLHNRVFQEPGSTEHILYTSKIDDDGVIQLVESGKENIYDMIQSHKDSCDIHVLLKRFEQGDPDALSRAQGAYGDFTNMPESYAQLLNSVIAGEQYFMSLPVEIRAKFGHSFEQFMVSMDKPDFAEKMGFISEQPAGSSPAEPAKEVPPEEA